MQVSEDDTPQRCVLVSDIKRMLVDGTSRETIELAITLWESERESQRNYKERTPSVGWTPADDFDDPLSSDENEQTYFR